MCFRSCWSLTTELLVLGGFPYGGRANVSPLPGLLSPPFRSLIGREGALPELCSWLIVRDCRSSLALPAMCSSWLRVPHGGSYGLLCIASRRESAACLLLALPCAVSSTIFFVSCVLVSSSLSVTDERRRETKRGQRRCCTTKLMQGETRSHGAQIWNGSA